MSWWNSDWSYRKKLTFDNSGQSENLSDFPVLVALTSSNFDFNKAKDNGEDIRFVDSDDSAELKYEIEKWDKTNQKAWIWVKVPQIDGSSSTDYIWMYYGNSGASDNQDAANAWDANYISVWHLKNASGSVVDSKGANNGTNIGATRDQTGKIAKAFDFDGSDDRVNCGSNASLRVANVTLEAWVNPDTDTPANRFAVAMPYHTSWTEPYEAYAFNIQTGSFLAYMDYGGIRETLDSGYDPPVGSWTYCVLTYNGTILRTYYDDQVGATSETPSGDITYSGTPSFSIGVRNVDALGEYFEGIIDEVRVSDIARSADWITAQYLSMTLAFITFGSEEEGVTAKTSSDAGSGVESLGSRLLALAETGSGIGTSSLLAALIGTEETGLGLEFATKVFSAFDSGSGIDDVISRLLAASETGSALEVALLITVLISGDGGLGSDLSTLLKAILASDEGSGFDVLKALIETTGSEMRLHARPGQVRIPSKGVNL